MKTIVFRNYRCFEKMEIKFAPDINLLIGDNASGKTSVLMGLRAAMSTFFAGFSDENTRFIGLKHNDFTEVVSGESKTISRPISIEFNITDCIEHDEYFDSSGLFEKTFSISLNGPKSRTLITGIKGLKQYGSTIMDNMFLMGNNQSKQVKSLPLFASFTTEDIHSTRKINAKKFKAYFQKPSFGYYECLDGSGFFPYWIKRLLVLEEGQKSLSETEAVRKSIIKALGKEGCNIIQDMEIRPNQGKVYYFFTDGREVAAENLSDGYARLVNIVTDLAFRCMLLNKGIYRSEACEKTIGTVLIDEIDLHLHPTLQAVAIQSLKNAFPKIQFIITSHSPMVMSGIPNKPKNMILKLKYHPEKGYTRKNIETYGLDASTIIKTKLGVTPRSVAVDKELEKLFNFIDNEQFTKATRKLKEMKKEFGDNLPELAKAQAMLNFMQDNDDKD